MAQASALSKPAQAFSALRHPDYQKYYPVTVLSMTADNIEHVISYWVIFQQFHSPALAGFAVISHWLPFLLLSFYAGSLADRFDCRRLIQISQLLFMVASLAWGLLFLTGTLRAWHAAVMLCIHGLAGVILAPADQLIIYDMVGRDQLPSAIRLTSSGRNLALLLGPAVGGAFMQLLGPAQGLLVNTLIYVPLILMMWVLPHTGHLHQRIDPRSLSGIGLSEAKRVLQKVRHDHRIITMIALTGASSFFVGLGFQAQMPEYAHHFGADDSGAQYAALLAANAAGAIIGVVLLESTHVLPPTVRTAIVGAILWSLVIILFSAASTYIVGLTLLVVAGILNITFLSTAQTLVQLHAPPDLRGRVVGLYNTGSLGLRVGSGLTVGVLGSVIGVHWSLGLSAGILMFTALGLLVYDVAARRKPFAAS
ncbi:MAG TPA: MFS transporter [Methylomirabilota bacterium]|nr:MFS transporter [Methylomirabilota bacterium]